MAAKPKISFSLQKTAPKKKVVITAEEETPANVMVFKGFTENGSLDLEQDPRSQLTIPVKNISGKGNRIADMLKKRALTAKPEFGHKTEVKIELGSKSEAELQLLRESEQGGSSLYSSGLTLPVKKSDGPLPTLPTASADQFETVPVEDFGAALLRGMGFDPKKHNVQPYIPKGVNGLKAGIGADLPGAVANSEEDLRKKEEEREAIKRAREAEAEAMKSLGWGLNVLSKKAKES